MAENSHIEWTDHTFNPWIGCTKVSAGCDHCYAETWDARGLQQRETRWGPHAPRTRTSTANWRKPLAWNKAAQAAGQRARVFCASLADVFDNHASILPEWRADLWALIAATPHLDWQLLTKRPQNIAKMLPENWGAGWPNVWLGTTAENQIEADRRIPHLLSTPAAVRFISAEPLLGPVKLDDLIVDDGGPGEWHVDALDNEGVDPADDPDFGGNTIDWVIVGGESGPHARPMHPDWARDLRDQCAAAGVAYFFKQWGEWGPDTGPQSDGRDPAMMAKCAVWNGSGWDYHSSFMGPEPTKGNNWLYRLGKKQNGALLDGREHKEFPNVPRP